MYRTERLLMKAMEKKLIELMGIEEYLKFGKQTAKECFLAEVMACGVPDFTNFVMEHIDKVEKDLRFDDLDKEIIEKYEKECKNESNK